VYYYKLFYVVYVKLTYKNTIFVNKNLKNQYKNLFICINYFNKLKNKSNLNRFEIVVSKVKKIYYYIDVFRKSNNDMKKYKATNVIGVLLYHYIWYFLLPNMRGSRHSEKSIIALQCCVA
jgi:hypothetical protein